MGHHPARVLPTLATAPDWIASAAVNGLRLELSHTGRRVRLRRTGASAAWHIIQTSLANAAVHADAASPIELRLAWRPEGLTLRIANTPGETALGQLLRPGTGIAAMRWRAARAGGWLHAGMCPEGYAVEAFLPAGMEAAMSRAAAALAPRGMWQRAARA